MKENGYHFHKQFSSVSVTLFIIMYSPSVHAETTPSHIWERPEKPKLFVKISSQNVGIENAFVNLQVITEVSISQFT